MQSLPLSKRLFVFRPKETVSFGRTLEARQRVGAPTGGLTVVEFANDHLQYALTWFALALMIPAGAWTMFRAYPGRQADSADDCASHTLLL